MKKAFKHLLTPALLLLLLTGCKKDDQSNSNHMTGKIDGVPFACTEGFWATSGNAGDGIISFRADTPPYSFRFYLHGKGDAITEGVYNLENGKIRNVTVYDNNTGYSAGQFECSLGGSCDFTGSGKITISSINKKHVAGSFEFATGPHSGTGLSRTVTEGNFDIRRD